MKHLKSLELQCGVHCPLSEWKLRAGFKNVLLIVQLVHQEQTTLFVFRLLQIGNYTRCKSADNLYGSISDAMKGLECFFFLSKLLMFSTRDPFSRALPQKAMLVPKATNGSTFNLFHCCCHEFFVCSLIF